jgi:translation initiation factor 2B subunit (eIF-2B alpha/beta/delta family)
VGADAVREDGLVKNKIGARPLAEAAQRIGVRTVVACELLKLGPAGRSATVEDEPELRDTTPPELVDEIVTEERSVAPADVKSVIERTPFLRDGYRLLVP